MFHLAFASLIFSTLGLLKVLISSNENWKAKYHYEIDQKERQGQTRTLMTHEESHGDLGWNDVLHIVMIPSYETPMRVLEETLLACEKYDQALTHLGIVLAFEEHEEGITDKAAALQEEFEGRFKFIFTTFHPPDLPQHLPGKSSNECWAFGELCRELQEAHGIMPHDPRVVITVIDDDSELHESYLEALTYHFLMTGERSRYLSTWQPPICHFKNYMRVPALMRVSAACASLHELACLATPLDSHIPYSSYSLSLVLASAVGGWDPEFLAEDWHMYAKCSLMTGGRVRCRPIFLPLMNYMPETDTYWGTLKTRWAQAKRHALGLSEIVYMISSMYLGIIESKTLQQRIIYLWRLMPLLGKMAHVHFVNALSAVWNVLAQLVIHTYMWRSWCYVSSLAETNLTCGFAMASATENGIAEEQILLNSLMVFVQLRVTAVMAVVSILSCGLGAFYFHLVRDRVEGDVNAHCFRRNPLLHWLYLECEVTSLGLIQSICFGAIPVWIAVLKVVGSMSFKHDVAGMLGRQRNTADV